MASVLLVRHADIDLAPAPVPGDPPLNAAGRARAATLAHVAGTAGVATVLTSSFLRTRQTVEPLAGRLGLVPRLTPSSSLLASQLLSGALGETVLVAGHSNTVPEMIAAFGVPPPHPAIGHHEFDNLFVVAVFAPGEARLLHLRYGAPA